MNPINNSQPHKPDWCAGCGDFGIWSAYKTAVKELNLPVEKTFVVDGIGCHGHITNFIDGNIFQGLHGRPVPVAEGMKLFSPESHIFVFTGDGDCLAEGGNHFLHLFRRNIDLTIILHNNQMYSLTTGQASPTTLSGQKTKSTPQGVIEAPLNPLTLALSVGATFVSRGYSSDINGLKELIIEAHNHKGTALIDVLQVCVTFNKINDHKYFQSRIYKLQDVNHAPSDFNSAWARAREWPGTNDINGDGRIPTGIFYKTEKPVLEELMRKNFSPVKARFSELVEKFV